VQKTSVITVALPLEQIQWLDENKGPELSRAAFIRTIIRRAQVQPDAYEYQLKR
jgi:hypothetical protein